MTGSSTTRHAGRLVGAATLLIVLALLPGVAPTRAATHGGRPTVAALPAFAPAVQRQLQQALAQSVADPTVPGMLVGIWIPGHAAWVRTAGVGDRTTTRPLRAQDHVRIGSITKTFVATVILQLVGEGKLSLNDPISRWAPQVPNARRITVRELLNMSSGLYNYTEDRQWQAQTLSRQTGLELRQWRPRDLVRIATTHRPYFPPGKGWHYSNTNFILLGLILEQVTGQPVADAVRTRILQPLGLRQTSFPTTTALPAPHPRGYSTVLGPRTLTDVTTMNTSWAWTAGAMISTLEDLRTWARALATGALLRPVQQRQRLTWNPYAAAATHGFGLYGLGVARLVGFIGHTGGIPGFNTDMWYLPATRVTVVIIANSESGDVSGVESLPADLLFQQIVKIAFPAQYPH